MMLRKMKTFLKDANKTSLLIIKYGIMLSCIVLAFGAAQLAGSSILDLHKSLVSFEIIKIGLIIFAESFVSGVIFDIYARKTEKRG